MKNIIYCGIIILSLGGKCFAQDNSPFDKAKFKLIKNAVWFYSMDTKAGWENPSDCANYNDYATLEECAKGMMGVAKKISAWKSSDITDINELEKLNEKITKDVLRTKEYRRSEYPNEFKKFQENSTKIIESAKKESIDINVYTPQKAAKKNIDEQSSVQKKLNGDPESTIDEDKARAEMSSGNGFNYPLVIVLFMAVIALANSILSTISLKKEIRKINEKTPSPKDNNEYKNSQRISALENEIKTFDASIDGLREEFSKKIRNITVAQATTTQQAQQATLQIQEKPVQPAKPAVQIKYAKWADMGDGFSLGELSDEPDNEKIFEIVIATNNTAKFKIASNRDAQLFALSNPNIYLKSTCKYDSIPAYNSSIITEAEGDLKLKGNKWQILNPARIIFS